MTGDRGSPVDLLDRAERNRVAALAGLDPRMQETLGQFFTPARAAALIAAMPRLPDRGQLRVLDPGAGSGMLSAALVARVLDESPNLRLHVVAVETDGGVLPHLRATLEDCAAVGAGRVSFEVVETDFITSSTGMAADERLSGFDLVIQNPPYAKLAASSAARAAVREIGADAPNLYAAFLALGTSALAPGGQLVAITPRSFCNGPYFGSFRRFLLAHLALDRVHVFESRSTVFADTGVLQENVIFSATRDGARRSVVLSSSDGHQDDATHRAVPYNDVVRSDDPHRFIRITTADADVEIAERMLSRPGTLADLDLTVSTGRVVDFRSRECLFVDALSGALPLIYPGNVRNGGVVWPREIRKAQWFLPVTEKDSRLLLPQGWYCVVKRFSAKEERRRIVAAVWSPVATPGPVAFENHLNVFHRGGSGLGRDTAYGLSLWLNSTLVDRYFRTFSGHTQVNATDLHTLRFPDLSTLRTLGSFAGTSLPEQDEIDAMIDKVVYSASLPAA
jgi:adenine-specific DNA-methyltransferase